MIVAQALLIDNTAVRNICSQVTWHWFCSCECAIKRIQHSHATNRNILLLSMVVYYTNANAVDCFQRWCVAVNTSAEQCRNIHFAQVLALFKLDYCWPCIVICVYQYSRIKKDALFVFSLLWINSLYMFRALLAHLQEALQKQKLV
jgi:hypothetical protein